jgi:hypothetical protein
MELSARTRFAYERQRVLLPNQIVLENFYRVHSLPHDHGKNERFKVLVLLKELVKLIRLLRESMIVTSI